MKVSCKLHDESVFQTLVDAKLYEKNGDLINIYEAVLLDKRRTKVVAIVVAYSRNKPIGVVTCTRKLSLNTYVLPEYRRKGVAETMIAFLRKHYAGDRVLSSWPGYDGWGHYFKKCFILNMEDAYAIPYHWFQLYKNPATAVQKRVANVKRQIKREYMIAKENELRTSYTKEIAHLEAIGAEVEFRNGVMRFTLHNGITKGVIEGKNYVRLEQKRTHGFASRLCCLSKTFTKKAHKSCEAFNKKAAQEGLSVRAYPSIQEGFILALVDGDFIFSFDHVHEAPEFRVLRHKQLQFKSNPFVLPSNAYVCVYGTDLILRKCTMRPLRDDATIAETEFLAEKTFYYLMGHNHEVA